MPANGELLDACLDNVLVEHRASKYWKVHLVSDSIITSRVTTAMADGKSVIVTGATGFLGRQVLNAFQAAGWKTVGTGFSRARPPAIEKVDLGEPAEVETLFDNVK